MTLLAAILFVGASVTLALLAFHAFDGLADAYDRRRRTRRRLREMGRKSEVDDIRGLIVRPRGIGRG